jgi:hypothetical protein
MPDQDIKNAVRYRLNNISSGQLYQSQGDYLFFRQGNIVGAAINTGDVLHNIHNINPAKAFTLDSVHNILHAEGNFLTLTANMSETDLNDPIQANRFADIICQFVRLEDGNREKLLADPRKWAEDMIEILGNSAENSRPYAYVAELDIVNKLCAAGIMTDVAKEYRGPEKAVHDFELSGFSLEVKSHLYGDMTDKANSLTISSANQLEPTEGKPLYVVFYRMEETGSMSFAGEVEKFVSGNYATKQLIIGKIKSSGYTEGDLFWEKEYHTQNEPQVYEVTGDFPRITPSMFKGDHFPTGIIKLVYTISLENMPSCGLAEFINAKKEGREPRFVANFNPGVK